MHKRPKIKLPDALRPRLIALFGPSVELVTIVEKSWFNFLHGAPLATTRRRRIYLSGSAEEFFADPLLVLHEYCHVLHQWERGRLTIGRYLAQCLRCGYWMNPFEIEARRFAAEHLHRLSPAGTPAGTDDRRRTPAAPRAADC